MKKKLIVSIALALVIVAVLAVCLSGCDSNKKSAIVLEEYVGNGYSEIYAKLPYAVSGWIHVDSYRIYDNGVIVIETNLATSYGEAQKRKFVTDISQVTFQCTNNGLLI